MIVNVEQFQTVLRELSIGEIVAVTEMEGGTAVSSHYYRREILEGLTR